MLQVYHPRVKARIPPLREVLLALRNMVACNNGPLSWVLTHFLLLHEMGCAMDRVLLDPRIRFREVLLPIVGISGVTRRRTLESENPAQLCWVVK
jgi:hypothetical protein